MPTVAVIIVNYNAGDLLPECLRAVEAQTVRPARVLVMDNGSRDGSIDRCRAEFGSVEFHSLNENLGFARANNLGVELVPECDWVALLNPDAFPEPSWIEAFCRGVAEYPQADAFASYMLSARQPGIIDGAGDTYRVDGVAWPRYQGVATAQLPKGMQEVFTPCAGAGFYRRESFVQVGGFNEEYFCYHEDVDLGFRLRLMGAQCLFLEGAVVHHVGSAIAGKGSDFSLYHVHRNIIWTFVRNMPSPYLWYYLPAHILMNVAALCWFTYSGRAGIIWRAKTDAIKALPDICRQRRKIQAARRVSPHAVVSRMEDGTILRSLFRQAVARLWAR
ncbi:MAG: glycosyltransferase family 2 protein [Nitrospira sp.]|nr:glycosyltransferase family 2 protein [Nitrospira sp.]